MKFSEKALFFNQLAALLKAGIPLQQSLTMAAKNSNASFKSYLQKVSQTVGKGEDLATALAVSPQFFDSWTISLVKAGVESGALAETCDRLGENARQQQQRQKLYRSIWWSAISTTLSVALLGMTILYKLRFLLPGLIIIALLAVGLFLNYRKLVPRLPFVGKIIEARLILDFSELYLPLSCGVPILTAVGLVQNLCANSTNFGSAQMAVNLAKAQRQIRKGQTLSDSLNGKLPAVAMQAISTGEETGRLDKSLEKLAEYYQRELEEGLARLKGMLFPVSIVAMGGVVGLLGYGAIAALINSLPN